MRWFARYGGALAPCSREPVATASEPPSFIERQALFGAGLGYVDAQLLAATSLTEDAVLWTRDRRLQAAAERLAVAGR